MMSCGKWAMVAVAALAVMGTARAADVNVTGKWKAEFDTQIGLQKYTYDFKADGTNLTGKATSVREGAPTRETDLTEGKINKDDISFVEMLKFQDQEIRIEYKGKIAGDEIKMTRKVGDFATEDIVAKRVKESDAKPEAKPEPKTEPKPAAPKP